MLVTATAQEYNVSAYTMHKIIGCESGYDTDVQSKHHYTAKNVPRGYDVGDREESHGLVQIHLPAHPSISKEQATDPEFATDFLAKGLANGKATWWSCYKQVAML
jgi:hypothetical protein